jgi:hypothetical protein
MGRIDLPVRTSTWLSSQFFWRFIHKPGDVPNARLRRTAMGAEMPRRRRQISLMRATSVPRCFARWDCVMPR